MKLRTGSLSLLILAANVMAATAPYPGNDSDHGTVPYQKLINLYTGNVQLQTADLRVSGALGQYGLGFGRIANSRSTMGSPVFGLGHNWSHNWQWEMVDSGTDSQGRPVLSVREPAGRVHRFTQTSPGEWWPVPSVSDRVVSSGDDYRLLQAEGSELRFTREQTALGASFVLKEVVDTTGSVWKCETLNGLLTQVTEPAGRWIKLNYTSLSAPQAAQGTAPFTLISSVVSSDGQTVAYGYAFPAGADYPVLSTVTYPGGGVANYEYAAPRATDRQLLVKASDPQGSGEMRGRRLEYYATPEAALGQISKIKTASDGASFDELAPEGTGVRKYALRMPSGHTIYRSFAPGGNVIQEVDELGNAKSYSYDAEGRGYRTSVTNELGKITLYENDNNGKVTRMTAPDGSVRTWKRDAVGRVLSTTNELGETRTYERDVNHRVRKVQNPDNSSEEISYTALGQIQTIKSRTGAVTVISYNDKGLSAKATNGLGNAASTDYDEHDRIRAITDARGNVTRFVRDAAGRVIKTEYADGTSAAVEYNAFGQITKSTDATGKASSFVYDEYGRPTSSFDAAGNERKTEYAQIGGGDAPLGRPSKQISPEGRTVVLNYDARGRVVSQTSAAGTTLASTTKFAYDAVGRKTSVTNGRNKTTQFFYNDRGLRIKAMNALNNAVSYNYDAAGRKLSQTDAKGNTTRWTYDGMGRVLTITDAKAQMTRFTYNTAGQRATLTDAKGSVYRFEYDLLGRQTAMVYPDGSKETATYNEVGNKATITNRAGAVCTYTYDSRNREIASEWSDGSQRITKAYDAAGRMVLEDNGISRITYAYDSLGRLASETEDLTKLPGAEDKDPVARTLRYTYTADGKRDSLTYPDGSFLKYAYDAKGQLTDVLGDGVPPPIASYVYDMAGNATRLPRENATETAMAYDDVNRLTEMTDSRSSGRKSPISVLDYAYDEADNRTSTTQSFDSDGDGSVEVTKDSYGYDATYQVTDVSYGKNEQVSYTYDAVGNRMSVNEDGKVSLYNVNSLNQYTQVDRFMPSYDRNGNLASMGEWIYKYDAMNRLCRATNGRMEARFYYDAKNRCVARSYNGEITFNYYDGWKLIEERDSKGRQLARYVHGKRIDEIVVMVNQRGVFYPHRDVLGNVTFLTDTAGRVVERYSYSVDGKVTVSDNRGGILKGSAVGNRFMYTGREWLPKVGLYDYRNRVYSAELGRFVQTDPIRFSAGDVNIYRYVANAMLNRSDAFGLLDLVAGIDLDFAFVGGIDLNYGLVIDTNSAGNSGFFFSPGPSVGDTFGLSIFLGAVDSVGGITRNYDVNMGLFSITSSYNTDGSFNGTVLGYGPGYGSALSLTFTSEITLQSVFLDPANAANNLQDNIVPAIQGDDPSAVNSGAEPISAIEKFVQGMERYFDLISSILNGE